MTNLSSTLGSLLGHNSTKKADKKDDWSSLAQNNSGSSLVSSEIITNGFKSAEILHKYLTLDNDTVNLDTVKNLYTSMLRTTTLTDAQTKLVTDVFNANAGANKIIDSSEMLKLVEALNGDATASFDPNAKETDRKIDRDGDRLLSIPEPVLSVSSENITKGFKSAEILHKYLTLDNDTVNLDTVKNLYKTMLNTTILTLEQEKIATDAFNTIAGTNNIIDSSEMLQLIEELNGDATASFDPNAKQTDRKIDTDGNASSKPNSNTYTWVMESGINDDWEKLDKDDGTSDKKITKLSVVNDYIDTYVKEVGNVSTAEVVYIKSMAKKLMSDGEITLDADNLPREMSIILNMLKFASRKDAPELGDTSPSRLFANGLPNVGDHSYQTSVDGVFKAALFNMNNNKITKNYAEAYLKSYKGNDANVSNDEVKYILGILDDMTKTDKNLTKDNFLTLLGLMEQAKKGKGEFVKAIASSDTPIPSSAERVDISTIETKINSSSKEIFEKSDIQVIIAELFPKATQAEKDIIGKNIQILLDGTEAEKDLAFTAPIEKATKITKAALLQTFQALALDNGKNYDLSLKELLHTDNWNELVRLDAQQGGGWANMPRNGIINFVGNYLDEGYNDDKDYININKKGDITVTDVDVINPLFETSDKTKYDTLKIPGDTRTITVDKKVSSLVSSLMENSDLFKKSVLDTLNETGYESLYILDTALPGTTAGFAVGADDDAAVLTIDSSKIAEYYGQTSTPEGYQGLASIIIHELGHLDGSLGADCDHDIHRGDNEVPILDPNENAHGPLHSRYIMERMGQWLQNTGQEPAFNLERVDYSVDTYEDRTVKVKYSDSDFYLNAGYLVNKANPKEFYNDNVVNNGVFDIKVKGTNKTIGQTFYAIQDALIKGDMATVTTLLKSLEGTTFDREYYLPHTNFDKRTIKDFSASQYITELLLYETIDSSVLDGFDTADMLSDEKSYATLLKETNSKNFFFVTDSTDRDRDGDTTEAIWLDDDLIIKEEIREVQVYGKAANAERYNADEILAQNLSKYLATNPSTQQAFKDAAFYVNYQLQSTDGSDQLSGDQLSSKQLSSKQPSISGASSAGMQLLNELIAGKPS